MRPRVECGDLQEIVREIKGRSGAQNEEECSVEVHQAVCLSPLSLILFPVYRFFITHSFCCITEATFFSKFLESFPWGH